MEINNDHFRIDEGIVVRAYMPIGLYPKMALVLSDAAFVIDKGLIFSVVRFKEIELEGFYIESQWLLQEEIRLLSAIALAVENGYGRVYAYPHPIGFRIKDEGYDLRNEDTLYKLKDILVPKIKEHNNWIWQTVYPPLILGGPEYLFNEHPVDMGRQLQIYNAIDTMDHLLIRGLGALLKSDLLASHRIFHTESCISLHIAMEASMHIILRRLRKTIRNPSALDAQQYLSDAMGEPVYSDYKYFADYYQDRIKAVHPKNYYGTYPDAPLAQDDFYDLYDGLRSTYDFLITGNVR
jgi:hypothetical protein